MNYGLYLSASGVLTNLYRQDVYANNLANAHTSGFKPDFAGVLQRPSESKEDSFGFDLSHKLLDRLGGGVFAGPQFVDFSPSNPVRTGNDLDVALLEKRQFFAVSTHDADTDQRQVQLTRDGRFTRNNEGFIVTVAGGHPVLNPDDEPIELPLGSIHINRNGQIFDDADELIGQIQVATVSDLNALRKQGQNLFKIDGPTNLRQVVETPLVKNGFVEDSGTDPIDALMKLIDATKSATGNANLIRYHDLLMDQAVNVLGRVVA